MKALIISKSIKWFLQKNRGQVTYFQITEFKANCDGSNNKKTHQEKQYEFAVKFLSFPTEEMVF